MEKGLVPGHPPKGNKVGLTPLILPSFLRLAFPDNPVILSLLRSVCTTSTIELIESSDLQIFFPFLCLSVLIICFFYTILLHSYFISTLSSIHPYMLIFLGISWTTLLTLQISHQCHPLERYWRHWYISSWVRGWEWWGMGSNFYLNAGQILPHFLIPDSRAWNCFGRIVMIKNYCVKTLAFSKEEVQLAHCRIETHGIRK